VLDRLYTIDQITELRAQWRAAGKTVVFTNGCFDILHRGHVTYLNAARELGDILLVGLNSDPSVTRLKGQPRPFMNEEDRAFMLLNLRSVDGVIIFGEDTPAQLIDAVIPDILIKGGDYSHDDIVGWQTVEKHGGKVITIPLVAGRSTSNIVQKIQESRTTPANG
jgi:rfaE bifunctional protein nucleotidyltransferase chain/domain